MGNVFRTALSICVVAIFVGCGESQPPIGAPGTMPQSPAHAAHAERGASWMLPEAKSEDLLYVDDEIGDIYAMSYPSLKLVGELEINAATVGLCVDKNGDLFVPAWNGQLTAASWIYEYTHGGSQPIATLNDPGAAAESCSVDPTTGNLAVANYFASGSESGNVEIYPNAEGSPTKYFPFSNRNPQWLTYDDTGDLFADGNSEYGFQLAELQAGSAEFSGITLNEAIAMYGLQWSDGSLIVAGNGGCRCSGPEFIYQVQISRAYGTVVRTVSLKSRHNKNPGLAQYWIQVNNIIGPGPKGTLQIWDYPKGGSPIKRVKPFGAVSVVLSVAHHEK